MAESKYESQLTFKDKQQIADALLLTNMLLGSAQSHLTKIKRKMAPFVPVISDEEKMLHQMKEQYVIEAVAREYQLINPQEGVEGVSQCPVKSAKTEINDSAIDISEPMDELDKFDELVARFDKLSSQSQTPIRPMPIAEEDTSAEPDIENGAYENLLMQFEALKNRREEPVEETEELSWDLMFGHHPQVFIALLDQLSNLLKLRGDSELQSVRDPVLRLAEYKLENVVTQFYKNQLAKKVAVQKLTDLVQDLQQHKVLLENQLPKIKSAVAYSWKESFRHPIMAIKEMAKTVTQFHKDLPASRLKK